MNVDIDLSDITPPPEMLERAVWLACARTKLPWEVRQQVVDNFRRLYQDFIPTVPARLQMQRDGIDFHVVRHEHLAIHESLCNWARVVRVHAASDKPAPMFASYRSTEVWQEEQARVPIDLQAGWKMERAVSQLPTKNRDAVRWQYVWPWKPPGLIARRLAVNTHALQSLVHDGRTMLKNRT